MILRPAGPADFGAVLALNEESVQFLSPLSQERLEQLDAEAELHSVIESDGAVCAFLLAFREGADYDSVNYRWFQRRYQRFLYVDRVVVSRRMQGRGAGAALYRHVFAHAAATSVPVVTCEYDVDPPNEVSERFHARFGFREVGRQRVAGGSKAVSLQASVVPAVDDGATLSGRGRTQ
jgi:hypothetical protein